MANILALAAVGVLGVQALRLSQRLAWRRLAAVAAAATLLISLNYARITHETVDGWTDAIGRPGLLAFVVLMLAASLSWPRPALRAIRGLALVSSPLAVLALAHALWMFLEVAAGPVWRPVTPALLKQPAPSLRRVVWLVFEELDQRITFEARPTGLELPELDRLRRESLYADAARPPAGTTDISMPALITGRPVVAVAPTSPNDLELTFADGKTARWSASPNVFSRARVIGYDTALIGWHLPYPRILGSSLGVAAFRPSLAYERARGSHRRCTSAGCSPSGSRSSATWQSAPRPTIASGSCCSTCRFLTRPASTIAPPDVSRRRTSPGRSRAISTTSRSSIAWSESCDEASIVRTSATARGSW